MSDAERAAVRETLDDAERAGVHALARAQADSNVDLESAAIQLCEAFAIARRLAKVEDAA